MIKTVRKVNTFKDRFELPVDLFEFSHEYTNESNGITSKWVLGGFYQKIGYPMVAFYKSDSEGNLLDTQPIIQEEGVNTYEELFKALGYTII